MPRIEGVVHSVTEFEEEDDTGVETYYTLIHLHSDSLCYDALFDSGRAIAISALLHAGDRIALTGPVSTHEDGGVIFSRDIDVTTVEIEHKGKMKSLEVGYHPVFTPIEEWSKT